MGSSSSKVAKGAARKYPTRAPGSAIPSPPRAKPAAQPKSKKPLGGGSKDEGIRSCSSSTRALENLTKLAIRADAMDPDFAPGGFSQRLQQMGVAQPNPTYSPSSTAGPETTYQMPSGPLYRSAGRNQTLTALDVRQRLQQQAEAEFENLGRANSQGRRFLDIRTIVDAIQMRDRGIPQKDIEARLGIQPGLLNNIGNQNVLSHITSPS